MPDGHCYRALQSHLSVSRIIDDVAGDFGNRRGDDGHFTAGETYLHSEFASRLPGCDYVGTGADRKARDFFKALSGPLFHYSSVVGSCAFAY